MYFINYQCIPNYTDAIIYQIKRNNSVIEDNLNVRLFSIPFMNCDVEDFLESCISKKVDTLCIKTKDIINEINLHDLYKNIDSFTDIELTFIEKNLIPHL
jgi:hypothetical protein